MGADTVFISYSHNSPEHSTRVLELSNKLRDLGVDPEIDQFHTRPPQGWPQWCEERLRPENSKYVLMICTRTYRDRIENKVPADEGRGAYWEGSVVNQYIYDEKTNKRFIPVLLEDETAESIPFRFKGYGNYAVRKVDIEDEGFNALYRELTNQPAVVKRGLGDKRILPPKLSEDAVVAPRLPERPTMTSFSAPPALGTTSISKMSDNSEEVWKSILKLEPDLSKVTMRSLLGIIIPILVSGSAPINDAYQHLVGEILVLSCVSVFLLSFILVENVLNFGGFTIVCLLLMCISLFIWNAPQEHPSILLALGTIFLPSFISMIIVLIFSKMRKGIVKAVARKKNYP